MRRITLLIIALAASSALASQPTINQQPADLSVPLGGTAVFGVQATGSGTMSYQWQVNGTNVSQNITTVAGIGTSFGYTGDGGPATNANLYSPYGVTMDASGNLYISDDSNYRIRKVATNGLITTICGTGTKGYSGDGGPAVNANIGDVYALTTDNKGSIYISDAYYTFSNNVPIVYPRIRKIGTNGLITTVAGKFSYGWSGDGGAATNAELDGVRGLAVDSSGNLFIADINQNCVRKVDTNGIITTVAGDGTYGFSDDGVAATNAALAGPSGLAIDAAGNLFIADTWNYCIRKVDNTGVITTVAGQGTIYGYSGDGVQATNGTLALNDPTGISVDTAGNLFITDGDNNRLRRVSPDGIITTVAGNGYQDYSGDGGPAASAVLAIPSGVTVDPQGRVFLVENGNNCIRKIGSAWLPTLTLENVSPSLQGGFYSSSINDADGSATSRSAKLNLYISPKSFVSKKVGPNMKIEFTGPANYLCTLQSATNPVPPFNWVNVISNATDATGNWSYTISNFATGPRLFFRMVGQ